MSVRTKLILIFLSLSVAPLAALTFLSYTNSERSLRELVAKDNKVAAADLQGRVSRLSEDLNRRVVAVTELPELRTVDFSRPLDREQTAHLASAMQRAVSDRWSLFSELEFVPAAPAAPSSQRAEPAVAAAPPAPPPRQAAVSASPGGDAEEAADPWAMKIFLPDFSTLGDADATPSVKEYRLEFVDGAPTDKTLAMFANGMVDNLVRLPGFVLQTGATGHSFKLRNLGQELEQELRQIQDDLAATEAAVPGQPALPESGREVLPADWVPETARATAGDEDENAGPDLHRAPGAADGEARRAEFLRRLDKSAERSSQSIILPVRSASGLVGRVVARVRPESLLSQVFDGMTLEENEFAFALDSFGQIHTRSAEHLAMLQDLGLAEKGEEGANGAFRSAPATVRDAAALAAAVNNSEWITVTQENSETGYTIGVVRRVSSELAALRNAALLNLFLGFTFIGLAGSGIIVFSRRMTRGLDDLTQGARRIAAGDLAHRIDARRRDEIGQLATAFNDMAADLEASRLHLVEQERMRRELEIARRIQRESLPRTGHSGDQVEILGRSIPSHEVGGDFYNYLALDDHRHAILIGDVSGKGVPAALMMAEVQATVRTLLRYHSDAAQIIFRLNQEVARTKPDNSYLTMFLGILDHEKGELTYVNAGHTPPFILRGAEMFELRPNTRPVGLYEDTEVSEQTISLQPQDLLCLYTDGVVESGAINDEDEFYGSQRLQRAVRGVREEPLAAVIDSVAAALTGYHGTTGLEDDATMLLVRIKEKAGRRPAASSASLAIAPAAE